jgi:hypothetical protein
MHISLDSALGQQRRLNSVGESITQIAPDPAAAYSLRSLTGGDPKVVRVRRASDNHEQDFTASDVSSGALQDFVNAQVVAPLDIQALSATGRDGDFLIAKAAYSLRSLGTRQATLAATGDTVARADGKYVCQVRRSSDDSLKSFTATEITDGTLLSFVNEIQTLGTVTNSSGNNGFTLTNASSTGFTATTDTATGVCGWPYTAESGDKITVSFDAVIRSGTPQFLPRRATALSGSNLASVVSDSPLSVNSTGSYSFEFTYDDNQAGSLTFSEGDDNADFDISNFQVTVFKGAGLVKTWYDQSVTTQAGDTATGNHATQATAAEQPKIVSAGALVTQGGKANIDFSSSAFLSVSSFTIANASGHYSAIFVGKRGTDTSGRGFWGVQSQDQWGLSNTTGTNEMAVATVTATGYDTTSTNLHSQINDGTDTTIFRDGSQVATGTTDSAYTSPSTQTLRVGSGKFDSRVINGEIQELIIYNTDQTDNRTAIEANLGEVYSIDLPSGVDPGFDQVDGFVETWYDQSGNGNNGTQTTASLQPKIVDAGSLITMNGKPAFLFTSSSSSYFNMTSELSGISDFSTFFVSEVVDRSGRGILVAKDSQNYLRMNDATFQFEASNTDSGAINFNSTLTDGGQFSLAFIRASNTLTAYVAGSAQSNTVSNSDNFAINKLLGRDVNFQTWINKAQELIFYTSDQTANVSTLNTNMASHYEIS